MRVGASSGIPTRRRYRVPGRRGCRRHEDGVVGASRRRRLSKNTTADRAIATAAVNPTAQQIIGSVTRRYFPGELTARRRCIISVTSARASIAGRQRAVHRRRATASSRSAAGPQLEVIHPAAHPILDRARRAVLVTEPRSTLSHHAPEPDPAPCPHRVPSELDPVLSPCPCRHRAAEYRSEQGLSVIGETGFEPATARPPAGAIQAHPLRFGALKRSKLL